MSAKRSKVVRLLLLSSVMACLLDAQTTVTLLPSAAPASGQPGSTVITLTGIGFPSGTINAADVVCSIEPAPGTTGPSATATATSVTLVTGSTRRVVFTLPATLIVAAPTTYRISVAGKTATGTAFTSANTSAFTVNPPPAEISLDPSEGRSGRYQTVILTGPQSNFVEGATTAQFGAGVLVGGAPAGTFGPLIVVNRTTALAVVQIEANATAGPRTVTVRTGTDEENAAWQVLTTGNPQATVFTLDTPATPPQASAAADVTFTARSFPEDEFSAGQFKALFRPATAASTDPSFTAPVKALSAATAGVRTIVVEIPETINVAQNTSYLVTIYGSSSDYGTLPTGSTLASAAPSALTILPGARLTSVSPAVGQPGASLTVTVTGQGTAFIQGSTRANFGAGVSVGGAAAGTFGPVTVTSPTTATATLTIEAGALSGARLVQARTGNQSAVLANGFTVQPMVVPVILSVVPNSGSAGTQVGVTVTGRDTHFSAGTVFSFGAGIFVGSVSITSATSAAMQLTIAAGALPGPRTVTATTGAEIASLPDGFRVLPPEPAISSVVPNRGAVGTEVNVTVSGTNTSFGPTTVFSFGTGISVGSVSILSATTATMRLSILQSATPGPRNVTATTGAQIASLANGFTVTPGGTPLISSVTPSSGATGTEVNVTVTGQNTSFGPSTVFSFGAGIDVGNVNVASATSAVMRLAISQSATPGPRNVTATTGAQIASLANGFTVTSGGTPVISSVRPSSGAAGTDVNVTVTGQNTSFGPTTVFSFGDGIAVGDVSVANATSATMRLTISPSATPGPRTVSAMTDTQVVSLANGFTVGPAVPVISSVTPNTGATGTNLNVTVTGQNTSFGPTTVFNFGAGIIVDNVSIASAVSATMRLAISQSAAVGPRTVTATTGAQIATLANGFTITGTDNLPPSLSIILPQPGSVVFVDKPVFEVTYRDPSGVDTSSLTFKSGTSSLTVECDLSAGGARCTPVNALGDGAVTLTVSIKDTIGNEAIKTVSFMVDSTPVQISITSPSTGLITGQEAIRVTGTQGTDVTSVKVNDVPATISGGTFTATNVPLRGGVNMLVALATTATGKTGTSTVDITRDNIAPIVRIDSPADGLISIDDKITVTGLVNDIVNGGTEAVVKVNGVTASVGNGGFIVMDLPLANGPNRIEAVATDVAGNIGRHAINVTYQQPVSVNVQPFSGDGQSATVKLTLPQPLVAVVRDTSGNPVAGRVVRFEVTRNSGTLRRQTGATPQRVLEIPTDGAGKASVLFTLGDTAGRGNNRVQVSGAGIAGIFEFCASGLTAAPQKILMTMGDNQRGTVMNPLPVPMEALVVDVDGNPIPNVDVTFRVTRGNGNITGQNAVVKKTGGDGLVRAVLTLGPDAGINNNQVTATFPNVTTLPATFTSSGVAPGDPAATRFSGVVLDNSHTPIPRATVTIPVNPPLMTVTDSQGQFELSNVPVGHIHLRIDPATTTRTGIFPPLEFEYVTIAGVVNNLGQPILIPELESENSKTVGGPQDVILTMKGVPGLQLKVFANSVTFRDGSKVGTVAINQVHLDKVPMAPPSGTFFMPPAWTIQPAGTKFNPPAQITIPNDGMPPGRVIDIFQFDHDLFTFINVGKGTTSADGLTITSDPGFGITAAGWGGCGQPQPPNTCAGSCNDNNRCTDDSCQNGSCVHAPKTEAQTKANGCKGCDNGTPKEPKTNAECCATGASNDPANTTGGYVVCCNGTQAACVGSGFNGASKAMTVLRQCARAHEVEHFKHTVCPSGAKECDTTGPLGPKPGQSRGDAECDGSKVEVTCLQGASCGGDAACQTAVTNRITQIKAYGNGHKAGCFPP